MAAYRSAFSSGLSFGVLSIFCHSWFHCSMSPLARFLMNAATKLRFENARATMSGLLTNAARPGSENCADCQTLLSSSPETQAAATASLEFESTGFMERCKKAGHTQHSPLLRGSVKTGP